MKLKKLLLELETCGEFPKLQCPFCNYGNLIVDDSLKIGFTTRNSSMFYDLVCDPTVLVSEYSYHLICDNTKCGEKAIVVGKINFVEDGYDDGVDKETVEELYPPHMNYKSIYTIDYISIPVNLIELPEKLDKELEENIKSSYNLFWSDSNSCGNRLRTVVELLLDKINVIKGNSLDSRIKSLKNNPGSKYHQFGEMFDAIRMLGNKSTHNYNSISKNDVVELYQVVEFCIDKIYSTREKDIKELTSKIINKHKR